MPNIFYDVSCPAERRATVTQAAPTNGPFGPGFGIAFSGNAIGASPIAWTSTTMMQTHQPASWSANIREDFFYPHARMATSFYDLRPPVSQTSIARMDYNLPSKSAAAVTTQSPQPTIGLIGVAIGNPLFGDTFIGHAPLSWSTNAVRWDNSIPQSQSASVRLDAKAPIAWTLGVVSISSDVLSPIAWGSSIRGDQLSPVSTSANIRSDVISRLESRGTISGDVRPPISTSAKSSQDTVVPESWIAGIIRYDMISPIYWLQDVILNYVSPVEWVSGIVQVSYDVNLPISWGNTGVRLDVVSGLGYQSSVRSDVVEPLAYFAVVASDTLSPVGYSTASTRDINVPSSRKSGVQWDNNIWLSWGGSTFPMGYDASVPMSWGATTQADTSVPVTWAGGVNPIQGDWLSPIAWTSVSKYDVKPPVATSVDIREDVASPLAWRQTTLWDVSQPNARQTRVASDALSPTERRMSESVDYSVRISWSGVTVAISYDSLSPIAWGAGVIREDEVIPLSVGSAVRRDVLAPVKTSAVFQADIVAAESWRSSLRSDLTYPVAINTGVSSRYKSPVAWSALTYNVSYDVNTPISWRSLGAVDIVAPVISATITFTRDISIPVGWGASIYKDASVPLSNTTGVSSNASVPFAWSALSGIATYYDVSSPISWSVAVAYDDPSPVGYAVALTENALVPMEWDGQPFTPDPGRTVYGPGGVRIAIP